MEKLRLKTKMMYGLIGVGDSALYNLIGNFALFFLTTVAGINPAIAGTITALGSVWDTLCGAAVGYISDNTDTRLGKRKPFLIISSIPLTIFTFMFFFNINAGEEAMILYYGVVIMLFWTSFSFFIVPFLAWGAELTNNYDERTILRGYVSFFNAIGTAIGLVLPNIIVEFLVKNGFSLEMSWQNTGLFCGVVSGITILVGALGIKGKEENDKTKAFGEKERSAVKESLGAIKVIVNMFKNYAELLKMRTVRYILGASVFFLIGYAIFCADRMYYLTYNMEMSRGMITLIMMMFTVVTVLFIPIISYVNRWFDKRMTFLIAVTTSVAGFVLFGLLQVESMVGVCVLTVLFCMSNSAYWQLIPAMIYDVCEVDQLINNKERAGMVISLQSLSEALSSAIGMQIMGLILNFSGFDGDSAVQTDMALKWTGLSFTIIPAVFMAMSAFCIFKYPITKKMYHKVLDGLKRREKGHEIDMEDFKKLK